jgi:putative hemolysin
MIDIAITLALIVLNGVFSLSELAILSARRGRLKALADGGSAGARTALALADNPGRFLSTVQIGITLVGVVAGAFSGATLGGALAEIFARWGLSREAAEIAGFGAIVAAVTYLSVVIGELVPKQLALRSPERIAVLVAPLMSLVSRVATPVVWLLDVSSALVLRLMGSAEEGGKGVTEEEIHALIAEGESAGVVEPGERRMIRGVMRLAERGVQSIMTPRRDVEWLDISAEESVILDRIRASDRTWLLACDGSLDAIAGVLRPRRLLQDRLDGGKTPVRELLRQPILLPDSLSALQALDRLYESPHGFGLIVDEYGDFEGIVTRADALRALRGEHGSDDEAGPMVVRRDDGSFLVAAALPIDALAETVGVRLPADPPYHTAGGVVLHELKRVPVTGDVVIFGGWRFEVVDMDGRRVDQLLLTRVPERHPR